jgi:hypothetical protein
MHSNANNKADKLSSWKEIAAYLDCDTRTCVRWEKQLGLPIHRFETKHRSRVFAYRNELDAWLKNRLNNSKSTKPSKQRFFFLKAAMIALPIGAILVGSYFLFFRSSASSIPGIPPPQKKPSGMPKSTGPLVMESGDIVTVESHVAGRMRIWRRSKGREYKEIWRIEPVRHASLAIGDLDGTGDCEIVAPGWCMEEESVGERVVSKYRYFLNIYKPGKKDWWKTTYYSKPDCIYENTFLQFTEIKIGDVDPEPGNEVILITKHCLGVFKYIPEEDEFRLLRSRYSFLEDTEILLKSLAVANIDEDPYDEIIVAADEWKDERTPWNKGWILIFKVRDGWPELERSIAVDANFAFQSLRIGDVIAGEGPEIICPGYRMASDISNTFIMGWSPIGEKLIDRQIFEMGDTQLELIHLDVGDVSPDPGDEVVVALHRSEELIYFKWNGSNLVEGSSRFPLDYRVAPLNVFIQGAPPGRDSLSEIIVIGSCRLEGVPGRFYMEVLNYNDGFISRWKRMGGIEGERRVFYAGFGRGRAPK